MNGSSLVYPNAENRPSAITLDNVRVASPCPTSWEKMTGNDRVRHCQECKLNVYNLSELTRREAEQLIASREGRLCIRFYRRADGTVMTRDCPWAFQVLLRRVSRLAGAALSAVMSLGAAFAQTTQKPSPQSNDTQAAQPAAELALTVVDPQGAVIPGAKVRAIGKDGKQFAGFTRSDGVILISGVAPNRVLLTIECPGFKTYKKEMALRKDKLETLRIALKISETTVVVGELGTPTLVDRDSATVQNVFSGDLLNYFPHR
jgi:Carboxypeptidase regulatory-like domain